jgi:hypothetical protein
VKRIPTRGAAPPRRRYALRAPHLCIDVREEAIYWASARAGAGGLEPEAWGRIARDPALAPEEQMRALAARGFGRELRREAALHAAGVVHERLRLPALSRGELRQVERRRSVDFVERLGAESCVATSLRRTRERATIWFAGIDLGTSERAHTHWRECGLELDRLQSRHLALGQLAAGLPPLGANQVAAIFDIEADTGTCVLVDGEGWIFSREVPLRFMGRRVELRGQEPAAALEPNALSLDSGEAPSPAAPGAPPLQSEDFDPLADLAAQAERLATELRRTFRYAEGQLGASPVSRVLLAGALTELIDLSPALSEQLGIPVEVLCDTGGQPVGGAAAALGMACSPDREGGNLLPLPVREARVRARMRTRLTRTAVVAGLCFGAAALALALQLGSLESRSFELETLWHTDEVARVRLAATEDARARSAALARALAALDAPAPSATALLRMLGGLMPEHAAMEELRAEAGDEGWSLRITVAAHDGESPGTAARGVSDLEAKLAHAPLLAIDAVERDVDAVAAPDAALDATNRAPLRFTLRGQLALVTGERTEAWSARP